MADIQEKINTKLKISVVIPTYDRPKLALKCAEYIRKYHNDIEIVIIDQKTSANINDKDLKKLNVKLLNLGKDNTALAKNRGFNDVSGDIIFFFDDDIEVTEDTINEQLKKYDDGDIVGTTGRVINDGEIIPDNTEVDTGKTNFLATKFLQQFWSTKDQYVDFPYGCNMSFKKNVLEKVGGFDEKFPKAFEEVDLGKRILKYGKIAFSSKALAYHHKAKAGGTRTDVVNKQKIVYESYGRYISKNVLFPFSLITLILRTVTVLKECPYALSSLYKGYIGF